MFRWYQSMRDHRVSVHWLLALVAACAMACGSEEATETADTGPIETPCAEYATARCTAMQTCTPALFELDYGTSASCQSQLSDWCMHVGKLPGVKLGPKSIGACASSFAGMSCDEYQSRRDDPLCASAPGGTLATGAACVDGYQCASRACFLAAGDTCGTCQSALKSGDGCRTSMECPTSTSCVGYKCVATAGVGEACDSATPCSGWLMCAGGVCTMSPMPGEACLEGICNNRLATTCEGETCESLPMAAEGEACGNVSGQTVYCSGGGTCSSQDECSGPVPEDRPCSEAAGRGCLLPAVCVDDWCKVPDPSACP